MSNPSYDHGLLPTDLEKRYSDDEQRSIVPYARNSLSVAGRTLKSLNLPHARNTRDPCRCKPPGPIMKHFQATSQSVLSEIVARAAKRLHSPCIRETGIATSWPETTGHCPSPSLRGHTMSSFPSPTRASLPCTCQPLPRRLI